MTYTLGVFRSGRPAQRAERALGIEGSHLRRSVAAVVLVTGTGVRLP
jgi:hypothetical protein